MQKRIPIDLPFPYGLIDLLRSLNKDKVEWAKEMDAAIGKGQVNWDGFCNPTTPEAKERVRVLREKLKMDPQWMKKTDEKYGPLEWHLPEASAIYWSYKGLIFLKTRS